MVNDSPDDGRESALSVARDLYDEGKYAEAEDRLTPLAEGGCAESQRLLGRIYRSGMLGTPDLEKALHWYERAARQGHAAAQRMTGIMYRNGEGAEKSYVTARMWFNAGAALRDRRSISCLGHLYYRGYGVKQNHKKAYEYFLEAAAMGDGYAADMAGWYSDSGLVGNRDPERAVEYFRLGTKSGDAHSFLNLGRMYWTGRGVIQNRRYARELIQRSADLGEPEATEFIAKRRAEGEWE